MELSYKAEITVGELVEPRLVSLSNYKEFQRFGTRLTFRQAQRPPCVLFVLELFRPKFLATLPQNPWDFPNGHCALHWE